MNEIMYYDLMGSAALATSLPSQVARELGRRVVSGAYASGALIEDEGALATRYNVSRTVIREAVKILSSKGLLDVRRGIGTRVESRSSWKLLDEDVLAWHQSAPPRADTLKQLMEMRLTLEPSAARWAAERATADDLEAIAGAVDRMERSQGTADAFIVADAGFHRAVLKAAHNEFLSALEGIIYAALLTSIRLTNADPDENKSSIPFHRAVSDAIASRNQGAAEHGMRQLLGDATLRLGDRLTTT
jgi:DNA-binding FadR family transcriptional regulator